MLIQIMLIIVCPVCLQLCHQNYMSRGEFHLGGFNTTGEGTFIVYTLFMHTLMGAWFSLKVFYIFSFSVCRISGYDL